jgi:hypothetical protein
LRVVLPPVVSPLECTVSVTTQELDRLAAERKRIRDMYLIPREHRPATTARGIHHAALISGDVVRTVEFYRNVLGFPLTEVFENRDLPGSTHFFFDVGHGNALAFFDLPGLDLGEYAEVLGGLHHMAISGNCMTCAECGSAMPPRCRPRQRSTP